MPTNIRDPRSIITPEAFEIDEALLGIPLARPGKRLVALLIDIVVIGFLTALTSGAGLFIWGFVAVFLLAVAIRGPGRNMGQFATVLFRGSAGCLGLVVLLVVLAAGLATALSRDDDARQAVETRVAQFLVRTAQSTPQAEALAGAASREQAERASRELLQVLGEMPMAGDMDEDELTGMLEAIVGDTSGFTDDPGGFAREMVDRFWARSDPAPDPPLAEPARSEEVVELALTEVLTRYREGLEEGRSPVEDAGMVALRGRIRTAVAGDSLARLESALEEEEDRRRSSEEAMVQAQAELDAQGSGLVALLRDIWDQAGSAVGLWSIYFTVTLTLFRGFTLGKRAVGIRVLRLDGEPITWWSAFERAGGYVAGIATGLLGFAQVYWDPNRQCVHDKIVGTVVVQAGAGPVPGAWETAWRDAPTSTVGAPAPGGGPPGPRTSGGSAPPAGEE